MANKDTKYTIEVELKGDSKQVQQAIKDGLNKDFSAKIGADTTKLTRDINNAIKELNSSDKKVKIGIDGSNIVKDINNALKSIESDSLKKVKLGVDTSNILRDVNKAITAINSGDSLKKLKLGVDVNYLQQQLNKAVKGLDTTVKLKTKLETTSRTSETKGTVTTNKTSKEEAQQYQSLFSKRAASIQNLDRAYQEFGRNSKEVSAAIREFAAASKDVRKFGRDTGVLSLNKVKSDIERQLGAGLTTDFTKNWLRMEYDKVLKDIDNLDRQLKPEKYEKIQAKAEYQRLDAEHKDLAAQLKAVADAYKAEAAEVRRRTQELKFRTDVDKGVSKGILQQLADSAKGDRRLDSDKMQRFLDELQNYRNLVGNNKSTFFTDISRDIGITSTHPYFNAMRTLYQSARSEEAKWKQNPITANVEVKGSEKVEELNQKILTTTQQFMRLRGEALKAGNALNQATDPKDVARLTEEFKKAIQALVNYQRATRGLTKGGEAQLVEKLAVGSIKEQTEAYKVLVEWIKKAVQAQRDLDVKSGRRNPPTAKDTDFSSWLKNMDIGKAVSGMAYAARGSLNLVQSLGNLISSLSKVNGVVGTFAKGLGALAVVGLAVYGVIKAITSAFEFVVDSFMNLSNTLGQIASTIYNILRPGIELYKTRQTAELAIAAAVSSRATENGKEIPFERAMNISSDMMKRVIADAAMSAFNPQELIDALRGTLPLALGKGWNLEQAYDVTKGVASVAKVINLAPNQVLQELRDILQGTISARSSQVAGATGMTSEELREAEQQGRLYEYIQEHLAKFTVALERYSTTLAGALDRLEETWALGMESIFQRIAPVANNLINEFIDNFIGVYKDSKGNILRNPSDFYTVDKETGEKKYKEAGFEWSEYLNSFGDALVDLVKFIAPVVDEILEFLQQLTGKEDVISAVTSAIKYMIRVTVTLGEIIASVAKATLIVLDVLETPISLVLGLLANLAKAVYHFAEMCVNLGVAIGDMILIIKKALTPGETVTLKDIENSAKLGDKVADSVAKMGNDLKDAFSTTTYDELFGIDKLQKKGGVVTDIVNKALNKPNDDNKEHVDWKQILGQAKEDNKNNIADQRKMIQAMIEDIKQALKQALQELKDIAEQNELAYKQGYKSIEDYFRQKAELEAEEARLKLEAAIAERDAIASLDTGGDASVEYQKQRDLIKYNSEIATYSREYNKKAAQQVEVLQAIERTLQNKTFQQGIVAGGGGSAVGNKVVQEAVARLGKPTEYGGDGEVSFDCSSLTMKVNSEAGIEIPRTADEQKRQHDEMQTFHDLQEVLEGKYIPKPGDSVYFRAGDTEGSYDGVGHVELVKAFKDGILETISGGNYGAGVLEKERELGDYEMAGFGSVTELAQKLGVLNAEAQEATGEVNQVVGQMPQVFSTLADQYQQAVKQGQKQMIDVQKEYAKNLNDPELLKAISLGEVRADMLERIEVAKKKYANIPAIAENLEKLLPLKEIDAIITSLSSNIEMKLKIMEHDAMAMNQNLREKTVLFPQAIRKYADAFFGESNKYGIGSQIKELTDKFTEYSKLGFIGKAQEVSNKIEELQNKFVSMVDSWITEMNSYFDYRRQLIDANSGLTSFVKEERKNQLDKGEARMKAVAYAEEAAYFAEQEAYWQGECNKLAEQGQKVEGSIAQQQMQKNEQLKQTAMRQAEINALLGEQKTLWQQTMDAANEALQNGLYNFMTDYINTAESIGEAFRNMAIDILKDLQKFFAKKAITDLMHVITGEPNEQYNVPNHAETQTAVNTGQMVAWLQNIYRAVLALQTTQSSTVFTNVGGTAMGVLSSSGTGGTNSIASRILHHATGGYISGKGTSTSDSIPAMLSNGEYVIKADAVRRYGLNFLDAVNNGHFTRMRTVIPRFADGGYVGDALQDTARGMTDFAKNIGTSVSTTNNMNVALVRNEQEAYEHFMRSPAGQRILVDFQKGNGRVFARFNS